MIRDFIIVRSLLFGSGESKMYPSTPCEWIRAINDADDWDDEVESRPGTSEPKSGSGWITGDDETGGCDEADDDEEAELNGKTPKTDEEDADGEAPDDEDGDEEEEAERKVSTDDDDADGTSGDVNDDLTEVEEDSDDDKWCDGLSWLKCREFSSTDESISVDDELIPSAPLDSPSVSGTDDKDEEEEEEEDASDEGEKEDGETATDDDADDARFTRSWQMDGEINANTMTLMTVQVALILLLSTLAIFRVSTMGCVLLCRCLCVCKWQLVTTAPRLTLDCNCWFVINCSSCPLTFFDPPWRAHSWHLNVEWSKSRQKWP